ncbi:hypothetical protein FOQG_13110 [Fusarium oxysporum f. sp. raphani 54005]|uniref:Uncharacterized protein n=1 Tax=Fusarium oxysporum f. sp. raphani 54005 TaxID=1089458 RepID=X0BK48_FUSOX|nr:hypothetical protein FOQG_13110 [Fusarium oxysporum f. sp. raphani 54005]
MIPLTLSSAIGVTAAKYIVSMPYCYEPREYSQTTGGHDDWAMVTFPGALYDFIFVPISVGQASGPFRHSRKPRLISSDTKINFLFTNEGGI